MKLLAEDAENVAGGVSAEDTSMKRSSWLLVVGLVLMCLGLVLSALWTERVDRAYFIRGIGLGVGLSILLVLVATSGRRWAVYVLAGISLVSGVAQAATLEPRRFIVSALELGAATAFVAYLFEARMPERT